MFFRGFKMYAVVEYKGNQYKAEKGAVLQVSKINDAKQGDTVTIDNVLLVSDGDKVSVGSPYVKGAKVTVEVGETFKDKKVLVLKYKAKKDYHRLHGHREYYTNVTVKDVVLA
jgi:large subunit ribosomal protein L21